MRYAIRVAEYNLDRPSEPVRVTWLRRTWYDAAGRRLDSPVVGYEWGKAFRFVQYLRETHTYRMLGRPVSFAAHVSLVPV